MSIFSEEMTYESRLPGAKISIEKYPVSRDNPNIDTVKVFFMFDEVFRLHFVTKYVTL